MEHESSGTRSKPPDEKKSAAKKVRVRPIHTIQAWGCFLFLVMLMGLVGMFVIGVIGASFDWWTR